MQKKQGILKLLAYSATITVLFVFLIELGSAVIERYAFRQGMEENPDSLLYRDYSDSYIMGSIDVSLPGIDFEIHRSLYEKLNEDIKASRLAFKTYKMKDRRAGENARSLSFFGDSVTGKIAIELLDLNVLKKLRIGNICNMGVGGANSTWGRFLIKNLLQGENSGMMSEGDIVFISYVWNDHWTRLRINGAGGRLSSIYNYLSKSRFVRLYSYVYYRYINSCSNLECPPGVFKENYRAIIEMLKEKNVRVILWTAPTSLKSLEMPLYFLEDGNARVTSNVLAIHNKYNELLRTIARDNGVELMDLDKHFRKIPQDKAREYIADTIHFRGKDGLSWFMREISKYLSR